MVLQSSVPLHGSRRTLIRTALAVTGAAATSVTLIPATLATKVGELLESPASPAPVDAATATLDALAQTPLGVQIAWFIAAVNDAGVALTEVEVTEHVDPTLLAAVPPAQLIGLVQGLAGGYGALTLQGLTRPPTANQAVALVSSSVGLQLALPLRIEADAPHRITGLTIYPSPSGDGTPLLPATGDGVALEMNVPLIEIGDRGFYRADAGTNGPTVVFEAGLGDSDATWSGVIPAVAYFARVITYDRPNTIAGASDATPTPRTADDIVADLHALLGVSAGSGPYVLVGHSVGGLFARLYASEHPDQVVGLVLVDASHELQDERRQTLVSAELLATEQMAVEGNSEGIDIAASFAQMSAAPPLQPMPLVVLSAGQADPAFFPEGWPMEAEAMLHAELQQDLAALVPGGRYVAAEQSGHYIQQSQPDLVVAAIRDVVQALDDPGSWATPSS